MRRFRARTAAATLIVASALVLTLRSQAPDARPWLQISDVGLPAVEELGAVWSESRVPWAAQARAARASAIQRAGVSGRLYAIGKVIVRFHDNVLSDERRSVMRQATNSGEFTARS